MAKKKGTIGPRIASSVAARRISRVPNVLDLLEGSSFSLLVVYKVSASKEAKGRGVDVGLKRERRAHNLPIY